MFDIEKEFKKLNERLEALEKKGGEKMPAKTIDDYMLSLGFTPNLCGFQYIKFIMQHYSSTGLSECLPTGENGVYGTCAQSFHTNASSVERSIRHAIERAFDNNPEMHKELGCHFSSSHGKLTNGAFLSVLSMRVCTECGA